jgi:hypothetical protein
MEVARLLNDEVATGTTRGDLAASLGVSSTQVSEFLRLTRLSPEIQDLAGWGALSDGATIPFSSLAQLAPLAPSDQRDLARAILSEGLRWKEVVSIVQLRRRSGKSLAECVTAITKLRPVIERRHVYVGAVDSDAATFLSRIRQSERDVLLRDHLARAYGLTEPALIGIRLGSSTFSIVTAAPLPDLTGSPSDLIEEEFNSALREASTRD